jgi:hypothetical protein
MTDRPLRTRLSALALGLGLLAGCAAPAAPPTPAPAPTTAPTAAELASIAERHLSPEAVFEHIAFLASDEMRGRDTPSPELERAAAYIADHFRTSGLESAGDAEGDYLQRWPFERLALDAERTTVAARAPGFERAFVYGSDYFAIPSPPRAITGSPLYLSGAEHIGMGLPQDARGRPLMVHLPDGLGPEFGMVLQAGMQGGAEGVVLLMDRETDASEIFQIAAALEGGAAGQLPFPVIGLGFEAAQALLAAAGIDLGDTSVPATVLEEVSVTLDLVFEPRVDEVSNVVGLLRGSDPELADRYIVLTAHYDHVGVGPPDATGDSIYSGADDNASGTAVLMQVASALAALPQAPRRSIVFLAVSGEEKGLLGAAHYAANPTVPRDGIIANLNMDMVGRNHPDTLIAVGEEFTTIGALAHRIVRERPELGLVLAPDPEPEEQAFLRSDHFPFVEEGIPALFITSWLHDEYHLPSDTPDLIDRDKTARVARLIFHLTLDMANSEGEPRWTDQGRELLRTLSR